MLLRSSIQTKIIVVIGVIFIAIMGSSSLYQAHTQRVMMLELVEQQVMATANSYMDGLNTLMMTGMMGQREIVQSKLLSNESISEARVIRHANVSNVYGPGRSSEDPQDELDRRALDGERVLQLSEGDSGRVMTLVRPMLAQKNYRGTNCLTCHQVNEGDVLGAIRICLVASAQRDGMRLISVVIQFVLLGLGLVLIVWMLRNILIKQMRRLGGTMEVIAAECDLTQSISGTDSTDELGEMARSFSTMVEGFRSNIQQLIQVAVGKR